MPSWAFATDPLLAQALSMMVLLGLVLICGLLGAIGYWLGYPRRYKPHFAAAAALSPIAAIAALLLYGNHKTEARLRANNEANQAAIRVAQAHIDATCASLLARQARTVNLERALQLRVIPHWPPLNVPPGAMDWPLPLEKVMVAYSAERQDYLRKLRFEQPYFERHPAGTYSEQLDYVERVDSEGPYAQARESYWRGLVPRLDDESRQELIRFLPVRAVVDVDTGQNRPDAHIALRLRKSMARHALEVSDVSTRDDRGHWTARLRVKVIDQASAEELFVIERVLPILTYTGGGSSVVRLCARTGREAMANDRNFDWLGYLAREVSAEP